MSHKQLFLSVLLQALMVFLISGCSSAAARATPTPDPSIVWADDFEDGDIVGWEEYTVGNYIFVNEGVLTAVLTTAPNRRGDISHESKVSTGTWSFDLFYPEEGDIKYDICLWCDQDFKYGFGFYSLTMNTTLVAIRTLSHGIVYPGVSADLGRKLAGWKHFDVTRDASGNSKLYLNRELILEYKDELTYSPQWFYLGVKESGLVLDNLVVRNQVIEIKP